MNTVKFASAIQSYLLER